MSQGSGFGARVESALKAQGRSKAWLQSALGVSRTTLWRMLTGTVPVTLEERDAIARVLGVSRYALEEEPEPAPTAHEPFVPNPRYRKRLPPRAYATVYGYLQQMEEAGATHEQLDEAERVMVDGAYNKLNSRDIRDRTEDEMIMDIDAAWAFIREVLRDEGMKLR